MIKRYIVSMVAVMFLVVLFCSTHLIRLTDIQGLMRSSFSFSHSVLPLMGMLFGMWGSFSLYFAMMAFKSVGITSCAYIGLPTLSASLCWATHNRLIRAGIPAACMVLFALHPVGLYAAPYTLYWLVPIVCAFANRKNSFLTALSSTFMAHAVGSVIHLYCINPMTPAAWLALVPLVAWERLVFACAMYLAHSLVVWFLYLVSRVLQQKIQQCPVATD